MKLVGILDEAEKISVVYVSFSECFWCALPSLLFAFVCTKRSYQKKCCFYDAQDQFDLEIKMCYHRIQDRTALGWRDAVEDARAED